MPSYAATVDVWDRGSGAATAELWPAPPELAKASGATTITPRDTKRLSIYFRGTTVLPKWFEVARDALVAILALPAGWNSYAAKAIDFSAVTSAVEVLLGVMDEKTPLPTVVPVSSGGVLLEWHTMNADLEVRVMPNGRVRVTFERVNEEPREPVEGLTQEVLSPLQAFLREI